MSVLVMDLSRGEDSPADPRRVNFHIAKEAGVSASYFRCANGIMIDTVYNQFVQDCDGIMPWGAYGVLYPTRTAKEQARAFIKYLGPNTGALPLAVDWEVAGVTWRMVYEYIAILQLAYPGKEIIIYSTSAFLRAWLPSMYTATGSYRWFTKFAFWQAHYAPKPANPPAGFTRVLWQYTDRAPAINYGITEAKAVDMSLFDGTIEQFNERFGIR